MAQGTAIDNDFFERDWSTPSAAERARVLGATDLASYGIDTSAVSLAGQPLPWRDDVTLYRIGSAWEPRNLYFYVLARPDGQVVALRGVADPIHALNRDYPPELSADTVEAYLWFFGFFVRGEGGPFLLVESPDDTFVPKSGFEGATLNPGYSSVAQTFRPISCLSSGEASGFLCSGIVYYSNAVFEAVFSVAPNGEVTMVDDSPRAADLPVMINAPIAVEEVPDFRPDGRVSSAFEAPDAFLRALRDTRDYEWSGENNLVVAGVAAALLGECRSDLPPELRATLTDISHFALFDLLEGADPDLQPNADGTVADNSVLGLGRQLVADLDCATEAEELGFAISFARIKHYSGSRFLPGCTLAYSSARCVCLLDAASTSMPELLDQRFDRSQVVAFFENQRYPGFATLYTCGGFPE